MEVVVAFDTHRFVKTLMAGGFTEKQAEVLASEQGNLLNSNLTTKADIRSVNERIEAAPFGHREAHRRAQGGSAALDHHGHCHHGRDPDGRGGLVVALLRRL